MKTRREILELKRKLGQLDYFGMDSETLAYYRGYFDALDWVLGERYPPHFEIKNSNGAPKKG
jgi:hypothetical protein